MDILIKNATIVTQNEKRDVLKGDILVRGEKIARISPSIDEKAELVLEASGKIAMPGLVNSHTHMAMTIFRGYGEDLPLHDWLEKKIWPIEARETPDDALVSAQLSLIEMLQGGTTCFGEMCITGAKEIKEAAEGIGVRGIVAQGLLDKVPGRTTESELASMKKAVYPGSSLVKSSIGPHAPYTCSEELLVAAKEFADRNGMKYQLHVSETRREVLDLMKTQGKAPLEYLDSIGVMDSNSIFVHASWVSKREIALAGKRKANICSCPISNLKLATGGICPTTEYDTAGANFTLGTDSAASNNSLNMFESMKMCSLLQKHKYWKAETLGAQKALDFATRNGAAALGWDCGSLEKGKLADIVLLERAANMRPEHDIIANIVYSAGPRNVSEVIINGRLIMEGGMIKSAVGGVLERAQKTAEDIFNR
ncbi:MAG: amidohydrolase [Candidatus Micrarchaeota archaeon]